MEIVTLSEVKPLWIHLDDEDSKPLYVQVKEQIIRNILSQTLQPGEELPSIRKLAKEARTSVITVKRAYQDLEQEGYIFTRAGKGTFVKEQLDQSVMERNEQAFKKKANDLIEMGRSFQLTHEKMKNIFESCIQERSDS